MINKAALDLIKEFEGFRADAYKDAGGVLTIGYGTTAMAGVGIDPKPGMRITEKEAEGYLRAGVDKFAAQIRKNMTREPNDNEFGAMVSLAYNIGPTAFRRSSVLRHFNEGNKAAAADAFRLWNKAGGKVLMGLTRRREAERSLFLAKPSNAAVTPKPVDDKKTTQTESKTKSDAPVISLVQILIASAMVGAGIIWGVIERFLR